MRPALAYPEGIAQDVATGELTHAAAIGMLRARGYNANADALAEAVDSIRKRDDFLIQQGNPWVYLGRLPTTPPGDIWGDAVDACEAMLEAALTLLARKSA